MNKSKIVFGVFAVLLLLFVSGCQPGKVTSIVSSTTTLTQYPTVTQTVSSTLTVTTMAASTALTTQATTSTTGSASDLPSTTTTAASPVEVIAETPDGKLQVVSAQLTKTTIAMYQVYGKVLNTSNEVLSARIIVGFLADGGGLDQTGYTMVSDIQPGQQKTFTVSSLDTFNNVTDFSIIIQLWN